MDRKMKLVHMHPLTLIRRSVALPSRCCFLCEEILSGSCCGCDLCWTQYPLVHQSCYAAPEEIRITYRPSCSLLFQRGSSYCDFCSREDRKYSYCCRDCKFNICFGCASKLIKYHEGQKSVEHVCHRHPLTLLKKLDANDMTCKFCDEKIDGPAAYGCAPCMFFIHTSCRGEILPEIRHNFHPKHSLALHDYTTTTTTTDRSNNFACDACGGSIMEGLGYRCDTCDFHLHPKCRILKPNIEFQGHQHLLILVENLSSKTKCCEACGFDILGISFARCLECRVDFHVQCDPRDRLPPTVVHKEHEHPFIYTNEAVGKNDSQFFNCNFCGNDVNPAGKPFYRCAKCNYFAHVRCAITEVKNDDRVKLRHFWHEHILVFQEIDHRRLCECKGCSKRIRGSAYGCSHCWFYLHKSCAEMPRQICNHLHHEHCLTLQMKIYLIDDIKYGCNSCNFHMDLQQASLHPSVNLIPHTDESKSHEVGEITAGHFSHAHHLVILEVAGVNCKLCHKNINGQCSGCDYCKFYIHNSCRALPQEIKHPFHPRHSLKLLFAENPGYWCHACCFDIEGFRYRCDECKFDLHPGCISLKPNIDYKSHHQHLLSLVENMYDFQWQCEACGLATLLGTFFMRCVECNINFHIQCGTNRLSSTFYHKESGHHLDLRDQIMLVGGDNNRQWRCIVCKKGRNQEQRPAYYYCAEFDYYAHMHCVSEVLQVDDDGGEEDEREKFKHFSHRHFLFRLENKRNDDIIIICCACEKNIESNPAYGCEPCKFYLHESCAKLPTKIQHPFHRHPLILPNPYSAKEHHQCNSCLKRHHSLSYHCRECKFNLDLDCSSPLPPLKLESVHKHTLNFLEMLYETPECSYCKFLPPNKITHLDAFYFRCVPCNFSRHLLCCSLPETIEHESHHHSLTLRNNFVDLFDGSHDDLQFSCDYCETRRDARESVYHCEDCNFVVDIECVFSEVMQFLEGKQKGVQGRIIRREIIKSFKASYKYVVESLNEEEKKFLESFMEIKKGTLHLIFEELKDINQLANVRISNKLSKIDDDFFFFKSMVRKLERLESIEEELVDVGDDYKICRKLAPVLNSLHDKYGDIGVGCQFTRRLKIIPLTALCFILQEMSETQVIDIKGDSIIFWWFHLKLVEKAGFRTDFALAHVKGIARVHFQIDDASPVKNSPFYGIHEKIAERSKRIDEERKEIEILKKEAHDTMSAYGSESSRLEAATWNDILKLLPYKATLGLLDDIRKL